jgi:hypothetical protein
MLIFGPIFWPEYHLYLCPFWGWLLWEARQSRVRLTLVLAAVSLTIVPTPILAPAITPKNWDLSLPEPYNTHMLLAAILMLLLAVWRLTGRITDLFAHPNGAASVPTPSASVAFRNEDERKTSQEAVGALKSAPGSRR